MPITEQDVTRIATLARVSLTPEAAEHTRQELNGILNLIEQLQSVDTQGIEPMAHPLSAHQAVNLRLREDQAEPGDEQQRTELMANAPAESDGLFLVPTVIE